MLGQAKETENRPDDGEVVRRVLSGDTEAFRLLVLRYERGVLAIAKNLAPWSGAYEDLAQDAFVAAFVGLSSFDPSRGRFSSWLFTITKNLCFNARKKKVPQLFEVVPQVPAPATPADDLAFAETRDILDATLDALPEEQRTTFVLEELCGLTTEQIAEIEGVAPGTIRSRLSRAKSALRAALAPHTGEEP